MKFYEFGETNERTMLILNGFGSCWSRFMPVYHALATKYHVIADAYDGFDPERPETAFKSHFYEAECAKSFVLERFDGKLDVLYACSYGNSIALEILNDPKIDVNHAIGDGMALPIFLEASKGSLCENLSLPAQVVLPGLWW